ncbi:hypothetical protein TNCV_2887501 [Trichonephila clavipes]|nr:hypothetical protein TNCV_2887501 [Trichonephila clavipes]
MVSRWPNLMCERIAWVRESMLVPRDSADKDSDQKAPVQSVCHEGSSSHTTPESAMFIEVTKYDILGAGN